jgi:hypothetical protein
MTAPHPEPPVFNTFKRKVYRPFYSVREFQVGLVCLAVLGGVLAWVLHRAAHPDPSLFHTNEQLLTAKATNFVVYKRPVEPWREPGSATPTAPASLGPFPADIVGDGWTASAPVSEFDESNLYNKIDGRETFYKSFGFKRLYFLSLASGQRSLDIELFDLGNIENALGAMAAEITKPDAEFDGLFYATANAGFLVQGRYYARLIGSDDDEAIRQKIAAIKTALVTKLPGGELPWAYALFSSKLRVSPAKVQYYPKDAFSFEFATDVYSAKVKGDTEVFVSRRSDAAAMAGKFAEAFAGYGTPVPGTPLFRNEYIGTIDGVTAEGDYVIGVRLAPSTDEALEWLKRLREVLPASTIRDGNGYGG